ncbi:D-glycero-beta-D-manno-heptose 1,7-bisphosphate 7-phosphatase [Paraburkholderia sp. CNPSo 3272]|uniref:D-glycero-beta-D-manno-heptose 1,7-bisphosphate 7-phosphatase n=1 Tax=Paraburkholderia sp. CNPSo 3272 TaxID=2940931 RepID=UPI0020B876E0|nr:D-glycero-beta-D-manno-heptose 1,7-bisphosphate 7-phosphatase [Paraburkholderia sp. CNPSo 3272]MCP3726175.1 D-glycero-beta-D-manno-heptose 1,7-bisphosphate 7-phosphatase [Paraburkholderia sp. CNPSo 3272]
MMPELKRALFLDRDGVINVDIGYLHRPEDCTFVPGIFELVRKARRAGYGVFVVTNQAGIARGYYDERTFDAFTAWMLERFVAEGAPITQVYYCPHHPTAGLGEYKRHCECRKPAPGMFLRAAREHGIDLERSVMIGDAETDMVAAEQAGIQARYLVGTGQGHERGFCSVASLNELAKMLF